MNSAHYTIFIPLYNEEEIVRESTQQLLDFMAAHKLPCEIILGSNGSTDSTPEIIQQIASEYQNVKAFHLPQKGPGRAFLRAVQMASSEYIISQDIDLSADLEFIPYAVQFLVHCVMIVGSKRMYLQRRPFLRKLGSNFFIFAAGLLLNTDVADVSLGAKAYRRSFVLEYSDVLDSGTAYVLELVYFAEQNYKQIAVLPVKCSDRRQSHFNLFAETSHKFSHLFRFFWRQRIVHSPQIKK